MCYIRVSKSISLTEISKRDTAVNRLDGWQSVPREGVRTIMHDGHNIVGYTLSRHKGGAYFVKVTLNSCKKIEEL